MMSLKNLFNKETDDTFFERLFEKAPPVSEGMIKRDNFFHSCWMLLKQEHPELREDMDKIELIIAGYGPDEKEEKPEEDDEKIGVTM